MVLHGSKKKSSSFSEIKSEFDTLCCRECGLLSLTTSSSDDADTCAVCLERACTVAAEGLFFLSLIFIYSVTLSIIYDEY